MNPDKNIIFTFPIHDKFNPASRRYAKNSNRFIFRLFFFFLLFITQCSLFITHAQQPTQEWVARYHSPHSENNRFMGMVVDKSGNAYVTGWDNDSTNGNDIITIKINSSGQIVWAKTYNSGGSGSVDIGEAIAVDGSGNVFVTGYTGLNFGPYDIITIKYDSSGNSKWTKIYDSGGTEAAYAIKLDGTGNIYVTGTSMSRAITIKYNTYGDTLWIRKYASNNSSYSYYLQVDRMNNVYVCGTITLSHFNYFIIKYDENGNVLWINTNDLGANCSPSGIAVDTLGNGAVVGTIDSPSNGDYFTVRFTSTGITLWSRYYNGQNNFVDYGNAVAVDYAGNTYVTGSSGVAGSNYDFISIKYNIQGDSLWVRR